MNRKVIYPVLTNLLFVFDWMNLIVQPGSGLSVQPGLALTVRLRNFGPERMILRYRSSLNINKKKVHSIYRGKIFWSTSITLVLFASKCHFDFILKICDMKLFLNIWFVISRSGSKCFHHFEYVQPCF